MSDESEAETSGRERLQAIVEETLGPSEAKSLVPVSGPVSEADAKHPHSLGGPFGNKSDEDMAALDTCGKYGGWDASNNRPCQRPSGFGVLNATYGISAIKCFQHSDEKLDKIANLKAEFLDRMMHQPAYLEDVCTALEIRTAQPHLWRLTDRAFARTWDTLQIIIDATRSQLAEDDLFKIIHEGKLDSATLRKFFSINRAPARWREVTKKVEAGENPAPAPSINAGGDVHITNVRYFQAGDEFFDFPGKK